MKVEDVNMDQPRHAGAVRRNLRGSDTTQVKNLSKILALMTPTETACSCENDAYCIVIFLDAMKHGGRLDLGH